MKASSTAIDALALTPSSSASTATLLEFTKAGLVAQDVAEAPELVLSCDAEPEAVNTNAAVLAIEFPAFNDGRALSLAVLLRTRFGYTGHLRAVGATTPELYHYLYRCGFDSVSPAAAVDLDAAQAAFQPHQAFYQGSVREALPVFRR